MVKCIGDALLWAFYLIRCFLFQCFSVGFNFQILVPCWSFLCLAFHPDPVLLTFFPVCSHLFQHACCWLSTAARGLKSPDSLNHLWGHRTFFTNKVLKSLSISVFEPDIGGIVVFWRSHIALFFFFLFSCDTWPEFIPLLIRLYLFLFYGVLLSGLLLWAQFSVTSRRLKSNICESSIQLYEIQKHTENPYNTSLINITL